MAGLPAADSCPSAPLLEPGFPAMERAGSPPAAPQHASSGCSRGASSTPAGFRCWPRRPSDGPHQGHARRLPGSQSPRARQPPVRRSRSAVPVRASDRPVRCRASAASGGDQVSPGTPWSRDRVAAEAVFRRASRRRRLQVVVGDERDPAQFPVGSGHMRCFDPCRNPGSRRCGRGIRLRDRLRRPRPLRPADPHPFQLFARPPAFAFPATGKQQHDRAMHRHRQHHRQPAPLRRPVAAAAVRGVSRASLRGFHGCPSPVPCTGMTDRRGRPRFPRTRRPCRVSRPSSSPGRGAWASRAPTRSCLPRASRTGRWPSPGR